MNMKSALAYENLKHHTVAHSSDAISIIILLYERIFDHLKIGKFSLENEQYAIEAFTKAHDLIQQGLLACLDHESGGEVAKNLKVIYEWSLSEIIIARNTRSPQKIQDVLDVLTPLYEAWMSLASREPTSAFPSISQGEQVRTVAV